jgi:N-methylhydantoinase A
LRRRFDEAYTHLYGRTYPESPVEFVNFCVRASLPVRLLSLPKISAMARLHDAVKGERNAYSPIARDFIPYTVYDRYKLAPGAAFPGPAIVEERESTVIAGEDAKVTVDEYGFLWIDLAQEKRHDE